MSGTSEQQYYEDLRASTQQHVDAANFWRGESARHESARNVLEQSVNDYLLRARSEYPILRLSKNQSLNGASGAPPTHWGAHPNCTFEKICTVYGAEQAVEQSIVRHPESIALLETLNVPNRDYHIGRPFHIWRMRWTTGTPHTMYQYAHMSNVLTCCFAYTKLESGTISGHWAHGASANWALTGQFYGGGNAGQYTVCHPIPDSNAGSILFALPAVVIGKKNIDDIWGLMPYLGDAIYD